jgi:hypothetical protein
VTSPRTPKTSWLLAPSLVAKISLWLQLVAILVCSLDLLVTSKILYLAQSTIVIQQLRFQSQDFKER